MRHKKLYIVLSVLLGIILLDEVWWSYKTIKLWTIIHDLPLQWYVQKVMLLVGLTALAVFVSSKFSRTALLRFYCCYMILVLPLSLLYYKIIFFESEFNRYIQINFWTWLGVSAELLLTGSCAILLWFITKARTPKLNYIWLGSESYAEFQPASVWKRILHYIVDTVFMMYFCYEWVKTVILFPGDKMKELGWISESPWLFALLVFICYYGIFEIIFKTTAGKCISNTVIANEQGQRPSLGQLFGRTFCRLIPFDPLSFFARSRRGWHDKISETYVTDSVRGDEQVPEEADPRDLLAGV